MCCATQRRPSAYCGSRLRADEDPSVDGWVKEVVGKIVIGVVVGPGAILCTIWGERVGALLLAWKAERKKRT